MTPVLPLFVVFEGIDGSGKSTLSEMAFRHYEKSGVPVVKLREPSDGEWGKKIREMLQSNTVPDPAEQLKLFLLDREDDVEKNILPSIRGKKLILMDRYYYSNAAYQGAMGIDPVLIIEENKKRKFPEPGRVYLIDIAPDEALRRVAGRNMNLKKDDFFERADFLLSVRNIYRRLADEKFCIIDGMQHAELSLQQILKDIDRIILS